MGKVGVVVGVLADLSIIDQGSKQDRSFAWVIIDTMVGPISIGLFYALNERARRIAWWDWMATWLHEDNWFLADDWNMIEFF